MLGMKHAEAVCEAGGIPVLLDMNESRIQKGVKALLEMFGPGPDGYVLDITHLESVQRVVDEIIRKKGHIDILINNAGAGVWKEIEKTGEIPQHLIDGMRELGLFGLSIPPEYGGLGFSVVQKALVHEMMGRGPWGLASFLSVHTGIGCVGIVRFASEAQKKRYLPKMAAGEWIGSFCPD